MADALSAAGVSNTRSLEEIAEGYVDIAVQAMANAIKKISVSRGYDATRYTLQCFGGAGGQHACKVADALGMTSVLIHPLAGVLSAYGMGLADQTVMREGAVERPLLDAELPAIRASFAQLAQVAGDALRSQQLGAGEVSNTEVSNFEVQIHHRVHVRYEGTDSAIVLTMGDADAAARLSVVQVRSAFEAAYLQQFAFLMEGKRLIVEAVSVEAVLSGEVPSEIRLSLPSDVPQLPRATAQVKMFSNGQFHDAALYVKEQLAPGMLVTGPAIIIEKTATTVVEPGWNARVTEYLHLVLKRYEVRDQRFAIGTTADPILLEVFNNLFMNIAEQMGLQLQNTAYSVNIKERLDFSCALFDHVGSLIANAPHMPVHLGSMGESIKSVIQRNPNMVRGDVYVLNDPYNGGTHLPDITVITPVFEENETRPLFYVASRGHHADVGGITPGSMPPFSTTVDQEGVQIDNMKLVENGVLREKEMLALLQSGEFPARNPAQNIADLKAQIAANEKGVQELRKLVSTFGRAGVLAYMKHVQDNAEESVRRVIGALRDGSYTIQLDNGAQIKVAITVNHKARSAKIDFTGTSAQLTNNFNAPRAVCMAAVLYVFRTLVDDEIPLNAGCLVPLEVIIPPGSMLNPAPPASVVAGNVETSTCITNALLGALQVMGASQCTVNNFTFGNERYQYYETISGGSGAGDGFHGTSVVQTHMTNSRLTDPEVLEFRFPVRLDKYEIRAGSGGPGKWTGGNGGTREVRFLEPMIASILSNGRLTGAFGMAGGKTGQVGRNYVRRTNGVEEQLGHIGSTAMNVGDVFVIETPGGGGYG
jgi:5-oxoprolinase (ATP-hydrolysing)